MTTPLWYLRRLTRMPPSEIAHRVRDEAVHRRWRRRQVRDVEVDLPTVRIPAAGFVVPLRPVAHPLPAGARQRLLAAADELLEGRWPVFARLRDDLKPAPDWMLDPRTGRRAPATAYCFDLDHRREDQVGNVKYLWETSRHQHVTVLAVAWYLTGDDRYAAAAAAQLTCWWRENPFLTGVHWTSGIELGIRLISWVWTRRLLDAWPGVRSLFEDDPVFLRQLHWHQEYLDRLHSHGSSANNHLIAEMAGQFVASCAFPFFERSPRWRDRAADLLSRELERQTFPDGLNRELATAYHGLVLELGLVAALEGERSRVPLGPAAWSTLCRMSDALAAVVDGGLRPPRQGDDDEAHGLLLDAPGFERWQSLLSTTQALFGRLEWWPRTEAEDLRTPLLLAMLGPQGLRRPEGERPRHRPWFFRDAGLVLLRAPADPDADRDEMWCRVDAGPHGYLPIAAHAHADALSIELRVGRVDVLADPGTYCYHGEPRWRAWARSTLGHNTLEVAGQDQSVPAGPFLWTKHACGRIEDLGVEGGTLWCAVSHDGYRRLRPGAVHRRGVRLDPVARRLDIVDRLDCSGEHAVRLAYHLGPAVECRLRGHRAELAWARPAGGSASAGLTLPSELTWSSLRGSEEPRAGWYSPAFDTLAPTVTLIGEGRLGSGRCLQTTLAVSDPVPPASAGLILGDRPAPPPIPTTESVP